MVSVTRPARRVGYVALLAATVAAAWLLWPSMFGGRVGYVEVTGHSMDPTLSNGDLVAVRQQSHYHVGNVIAYRIRNGEFGAGRIVIHRIVGGDEHDGFLTRGDNRTTDDMWHPTAADIKGARWFRIPGIGTTIDRVRTPIGLAAFCGCIATFALLVLIPKSRTMSADPRPTPPDQVPEPNPTAIQPAEEAIPTPTLWPAAARHRSRSEVAGSVASPPGCALTEETPTLGQ